jgi:diguanylate cyclase (GGDEF)-like protein
MGATPVPPPANLSSAFAEACRVSQSDDELFERCRDVLVQRFQSEHIWLTATNSSSGVHSVGPGGGPGEAPQVAKLGVGETEVVVHAEAGVAEPMRAAALPMAIGLSVVLELRGVLRERQAELDDAVFQLRALRQVARLLSSVHSADDTERLILDFMAEVFFTSWACLYRRSGDRFAPASFRSREHIDAPSDIPVDQLEAALPPGSTAATGRDVAVAALMPAGTALAVPMDAGVERLAVLALGPRLNGQPYGRPEHELVGTLAFAAAIALKNAELVERLHSAATTDELTGLYNRRALEERLEAELSRAERHQLRTSVVLVDLDHFKAVNDTLGHAAGDRFLTIVADILAQQRRTLDSVGRIGGDEFLVVLPMTSAEEAMVFVRRVQTKLAAIGDEYPVYANQTVSLGVAEAPRHARDVPALMDAADQAMYNAKRSGRARASIAADSD